MWNIKRVTFCVIIKEQNSKKRTIKRENLKRMSNKKDGGKRLEEDGKVKEISEKGKGLSYFSFSHVFFLLHIFDGFCISPIM